MRPAFCVDHMDGSRLCLTRFQVYVIFENADGLPGGSLEAVARVASPAFPCDKLRPEVRYAL